MHWHASWAPFLLLRPLLPTLSKSSLSAPEGDKQFSSDQRLACCETHPWRYCERSFKRGTRRPQGGSTRQITGQRVGAERAGDQHRKGIVLLAHVDRLAMHEDTDLSC